MAKSKAELKAALDAARKAASIATKRYQNAKSYDADYAQIKAANDGAINDLNEAQDNFDKASKKPAKKQGAFKPGFDLVPGASDEIKLKGAQQQLNAASDQMDNWPVGSKQYNDAKAAYTKNQKIVEDLKAKVGKTAEEQKAKSTTDAADAAQKKLEEATARAADKPDDPAAKKAVEDAKVKLDNAKKVISASTSGFTLPKPTPQTGNQYATTGPSGPAKPGIKNGNKVVIPTADEAHAKAEAALQSLGSLGNFAIQMGLINSDPSLKEIFQKDVYDPISKGLKPVDIARFRADIINSKWYTSYAEPAREAEAARYGDPGTWLQSTASAQKMVKDAAIQQGYDLTNDQIATIADYALHKSGGKAEAIGGLVLNEVKSQIMSVGKINVNGGLAASGIAGLKSTAGDYGVSHLYNDKWYQDQQDAILKGTTTQAAVEGMIKANAGSAYGALKPMIDAGMSVKSIMSPYAQLYGTTLELDPNAIDVSDPQFAGNAFMQDPTDPMKQILKPLWQYQQDLKNDPRWAFTNNARADLNNVGHTILQNLGLTY